MKPRFDPIKVESLKDVFIHRFEQLIFSGELKIGQRLPSERELAEQLSVSRPVVHEGLIALAAKGLVTMKPRNGAVVNDYRKDGSPAILNSLFRYTKVGVDTELLDSLLDMRDLMEVETAGLAALNRTQAHLKELKSILKAEQKADSRDLDLITRLDFDMHHTIAMASANMVYPLIMNSFKAFYMSLAKQFFAITDVTRFVLDMHSRLIEAIEGQEEEKARELMKSLIAHGAENLKKALAD